MSVAAPVREPQLQRRVRRFALFLLVVVVGLIGLTVAYVQLFDRVLLVEILVAAALVVATTAWIAWRRRRGPR